MQFGPCSRGGLFGDFESFLPFLVNFGHFSGSFFPFWSFFGSGMTSPPQKDVEAVL
jgi:hypothetical protein